MKQTITEGTPVSWKESAHRLRTTFQYFAESFDGGKGAFEMRHSFLYFFGTHFRIFVHKFLVHLRTVYASPLARPLARAGKTSREVGNTNQCTLWTNWTKGQLRKRVGHLVGIGSAKAPGIVREGGGRANGQATILMRIRTTVAVCAVS